MSVIVPVLVPSVPTSFEDPTSLNEAVGALKANVESLTGAHTKYHVSDVKTPLSIALAVAISRATPP